MVLVGETGREEKWCVFCWRVGKTSIPCDVGFYDPMDLSV